ncbi:MAG: SPASM domain-containing protein [Bacteroidia bacterium]|nr:SPASM domain-containing protein [Bacteroidia bacterium]
MSIEYNWGRKGLFRKLMHGMRKRLPAEKRIRLWQKTAKAVFERKKYAQKVPLFTAIELETRTRCNSTCSFCAASILTDQREDKYMPESLFEKILDELVSLDYRGTVRFFVNNEPLLDKRTPDFVREVKRRLPHATTEVQTNGLKLNPANGRELMEAGLDVLFINNYTDKGKMHRGVNAFLAETAPDFPDRRIQFNLRQVDEKLLNRGGTAPNGELPAASLPLPCILPFDEIVVTADGRVTLCCQDHYFKEEKGNVNRQTLQEIWYGEGFQRLRAALLQGDRSTSDFCKVCDFRGFKNEHLTEKEIRRNRWVGDML